MVIVCVVRREVRSERESGQSVKVGDRTAESETISIYTTEQVPPGTPQTQ
jgi:hypothetical protein